MRYVVDIETTSSCDLPASGAWAYAEHPSTRLLCIAWCDADSDAAPESWDCLTGTPEQLLSCAERLLSADLLIAHNANFERHCMREIMDPRFGEASRWACSAMLAGACGRPRSLRDACRSLCFPEDKQKDARGTRLLGIFSYKTPKGRIYEPDERPDDFAVLVEYCQQDVVAERALWRALEPYADAYVRPQWLLDCEIEDGGVPIDAGEVEGARRVYARLQSDAEARCSELTGGVPLRSTPALRKWTASQGWPLSSFASAAVDEALQDTMMCEAYPVVAEFLRLRKAAAGTAGKKYEAILSMLAHDGRCHGILVGRAAHTGRYAGKGLQPQNLPRGTLDKSLIPAVRDIAHAVSNGMAVERAEAELEFLVGDASNDALASILRDCIAPASGVLVVSDYSAIEARVLAWLSGETWVEEIFRGDGKIYERTAAAMYKKSVENVTKHERMAGKIATLALGYGGGTGALQAFAAGYGVDFAAGYGVDFDDATAEGIVSSWRKARPKTVRLWEALGRLLTQTVQTRAKRLRLDTGNAILEGCWMNIAGRDVAAIVLPSGRRLYYWAPRVESVNGRTEIAVEVYGTGAGPAAHSKPEAVGASYSRVWGGKLCENIVQAVAFDLLLTSLLRMQKAGLKIAFHVHDEIVVECPEDDAERVARLMVECMTTPPDWAKGLPLATAPEIMPRYRK